MIMENINLNELRDRAYKTACGHGFHDKELSNEHCLCLVISELMEAVEADRKGKHADRESFKSSYEDEEPHDDVNFKYCFEKYIKDTIPDELSDAVIRLLDLAGLRNISIDDFPKEAIYGASESCVGETFTESIYAISTLPIRYFYEYNYSFESQIGHMLLSIFGLAKHMNIDLIWHINQKMRYNELGENKHGKEVLIMKREIKFRGKSIYSEEWLYGSLVKIEEDRYAIIPNLNDIEIGKSIGMYEVHPETVG